jgi:hypothetical protein
MNTYTTTLTIVDKHLPGEPPLKETVTETGLDAAHAIGKAVERFHRDGFVVVDIAPVASFRVVEVCAACGDELGVAGFRFINGTRYCGPCARAKKNDIGG